MRRAQRVLAEWRLEGEGYLPLQVSLPAEQLSPGRPVDVVFDLPDIVSPNEAQPGSGDPRRLGMGVRRVTLAH